MTPINRIASDGERFYRIGTAYEHHHLRTVAGPVPKGISLVGFGRALNPASENLAALADRGGLFAREILPL